MEKIIESKICKQCSTEFDITDADMAFYEKVSPVFNGIKYNIPTPTLCPDCRQQRRLAWRNERKLYKRNCDASGKQIISMYSQDKPYKVYDSKVWWSDSWNPMDYGRDFDFDRGFFEQFEELFREVPQLSLLSKNTENSPYVNNAGDLKNCYLIFDSDFCEDCYYSNMVKNSQKVIDSSYCFSSSNLYECINCTECNLLKFSKDCNNCSFSSYLDDCYGCQYCYGCVGLINTKYHILNQPVDPEKYEEQINLLLKSGEFLKKFKKLSSNSLEKKHIISSLNVTGNYITNSNNCLESYDINNCQNCKYCDCIFDVEDSMDISSYGDKTSLCYESLSIGGNSFRIAFSTVITSDTQDLLYCHTMLGCKNCFGSTNLINKQYCILNKQYNREEYEILVPKIIEHMQKASPIKKDEENGGVMNTGIEWGEFFPVSISPFGYNETVAMEYYPAKITDDKKQMITEDGKKYNVQIVGESNLDNSGDSNLLTSSENIFGQSFSLFNWSLYESPKPEVSKIIPAVSLPDNIIDVPDDILNWAIECEVTGRPYRIIKQELEFYRKHNLPIPRRHPDERHLDRLRQRNPRRLFERN